MVGEPSGSCIMKLNLTSLIFSIIFILGTFYISTPLQILFGSNPQLFLICIYTSTILWFLFTETSIYIRIFNSRYVFLIIALVLNFLMIRSSYSIRELGTSLALLPIIFSKRVGIKNIINLVLILNITFLLLTSFIEIFNYLGFVDLSNWDVTDLPWVSKESIVFKRTLRQDVCFFNPYFISFMEYQGTISNCLDMNKMRQLNFFWIEPTGIMYSSAFLLLSYATGLFKSFRINLVFLFFINFLSRSATAIGSLLIIILLRCFSKIAIFRLPKIFKYTLGILLLPLSVVILLKLIEIYYPVKAESSYTIFFIIRNFFNNITLFGDSTLKLSGTFSIDGIDGIPTFGASSIPIRYGILGFIAWLITYIPFFIRPFVYIGFNNTNKNTRALFAYCALLVSSIMILRQNTLFTPFIILIGEYVQMKFPSKE